jgi:hypothetical protein
VLVRLHGREPLFQAAHAGNRGLCTRRRGYSVTCLGYLAGVLIRKVSHSQWAKSKLCSILTAFFFVLGYAVGLFKDYQEY